MNPFYIWLTMVLFLVKNAICTEQSSQNAWILVADTEVEIPWWFKGMPMNGKNLIWQSKIEGNSTIIKIELLQSLVSKKCIQMIVKIDSSQQFNPNAFQSSIPVSISSYDSDRLLKHWSNESHLFNLMANGGKLTISGNDFYFWVNLGSKFTVSYSCLCLLIMVLIVKTEVTSAAKKRFATPEFIVPGLLTYFLVYPRGIILSTQDILFGSNWEHGYLVSYCLAVYLWLPYSIKIYHIFFQASMFRSKNIWRSRILGGLSTLLSAYGIFWGLNEISILIVFAIQVALPPTFEDNSQSAKILTSVYFVDVTVLFYLFWYPLYPSATFLQNGWWQIVVILIIIFEVILAVFKKAKLVMEDEENQEEKEIEKKEAKKQESPKKKKKDHKKD